MLSFSNFNKHLSAVRETHAIVKRAVELSKGTVGDALEHTTLWLQSHNIVGQLLRANLHQKQYVDQVRLLTLEYLLNSTHKLCLFCVQNTFHYTAL